MKRINVCVCALMLCATSAAEAGPLSVKSTGVRSASVCRSRQVVVANREVFVAVPFAVPVAVPVATFVQPTYLYAYGAYATSTLTATTPAAVPTTNAAEWDDRISQADTANLDRRAVAVLTKRCVSCHSGDGAGGDLVIADEEGHIAEKLPRHRILRAIEAGTMPPPKEAAPLEPAEIEAIRHWARLPRDLAY